MTLSQRIKNWFDLDYQLTKATDEIIELKQRIAGLKRDNENLKKSRCDHLYSVAIDPADKNSFIAICRHCGFRT
jgi:uncharacterized ferredoxin-like protein